MKFWTNSFIVLFLFTTVICSWFFYKELTAQIYKTGGEVIGKITFKKRIVSRRYSDNVIWEDIDQGTEIFNYDAVSTPEFSSAVIDLKDGTRIELDQNTLLVAIFSENGLDIDFNRGGIAVQKGPGRKGLITLNLKDAKIDLEKGGISVNSNDSGMNINITTGKAKVTAGEKMVNISSGELMTLVDGVTETHKGSLFPESPVNNSYFISFSKIHTVKFMWRSEPPGYVKLEICSSKDFKSIIKSYDSVKTGLDISLPEGDYYWRIKREDAVSNSGKFTIIYDRKPVLIAPHLNQKISVIEGSEAVTFQWLKSHIALSYKLTVARDFAMSDIALNLTSKANIISTSKLPPGTYFWTVKSMYPQGIISDSTLSATGIFAVEKLKFSIAKPVPYNQGRIAAEVPFHLNWKGVPGAKNYLIEIAFDAKFKNILLQKNTADTNIKINRKIMKGRYFWRVSAVIGNRSSAKSITAILELIKPVEVININPPAGAILFDKPDSIHFSWLDPNRGEKYQIVISDRISFETIDKIHTSIAPEIHVKSPGAGSYFWRVILQDKAGKAIVQSAVSEFTIPGDLKTPVQIIPLDNEKIIPVTDKQLKFEWGNISEANEYEIKIFQSIGGTEKAVISYSSKQNYFAFPNIAILKNGKYSWIVIAKQMRKGRITDFKESKKSYFHIEAVMLLHAPVIHNPGIIFQ